MEKHRFAAGDVVRVDQKLPDSAVLPGIYTIVRTLPLAGRGLQYRGRNGVDQYDVILDETSLHPAPQ
jgi:hypothetical protein